jgi:Leucine-rich repeat (LRR) protein
MSSEAVEIRLVGFEGGGKKLWRGVRSGNEVEITHGLLVADGAESAKSTKTKTERKSFDDAAKAQAFLDKQLTARLDKGYFPDLPYQVLTWAEVKAEVLSHLGENGESDDDRVLVLDGDVSLPHGLGLDYRQGLFTLADESEHPFTGLIVRGNLTLAGCLSNYDDDYGPFLLVTGDLTAPSLATGGARVCALGAITCELIIGVYNHGCVEAKGPLRAHVVASEHTVAGNPLDAIHYGGWGRNAFAVRGGTRDPSDAYEPGGLFVSALLKSQSVDLAKARQLAVANKPVVKDAPVSVRAAIRKLLGKKLDEPEKVKSLSLPGKDLSSLPDEIFLFTKLEKLTLTHNKLYRLPEALGQLTELRELHVRGNGLQELPDSIGQLTKLRVLDLEANCIWRLPDSLAQCAELRTVNLTNNPYSYVRASFGGWSKVKLMWDFPEVLTYLPRLETVTFSGTFVRELPSRRFDSPHLKKVSVENSLVQHVDPQLHDQITVDLQKSLERPVNYIRYWFDTDEIQLDHFYSHKTRAYDFTRVLALLELLFQVVLPSAPIPEALAAFDKQIDAVAHRINWGGKFPEHQRALFTALVGGIDAALARHPAGERGHELLRQLRPKFEARAS